MIPRHKKKAIIGIPSGLLLFGGCLYLSIEEMIPEFLRAILAVSGIVLYIWGCLALAKAKGYSTAVVLTVILGVLFPVVVLLALPDKHKHWRR